MDRETIKKIQAGAQMRTEQAAMDASAAPINKQHLGISGPLSNQIDPNWQAEQKAAEEQRVRSACLQAAAQQMPTATTAEVVDRAKQFYDFIKGA